MYIRTAQAAVWQGPTNPPAEPAALVTEEVAHSEHAASTRWARAPFQSRGHGHCIAVRLQRGQVWVAIAGSPKIRWLPVEQVLSETEVARWLASGF